MSLIDSLTYLLTGVKYRATSVAKKLKKMKKIKKFSKKNKFSNALCHHCTDAWVTRPERPKGVKDVIKQA